MRIRRIAIPENLARGRISRFKKMCPSTGLLFEEMEDFLRGVYTLCVDPTPPRSPDDTTHFCLDSVLSL
jgi:hypothetical protein